MAARLSIRPPQAGDVRALSEAETCCFTDPWPAQFFLSEIVAPGRFNRLLVDPAGEMVAYLFCAWQYLDLHVLKVATLPRFRRGGLARRVMGIAEHHAVEVCGESLTLEVRAGNKSAIALYEALDYAHAGWRKSYYGDGEDAVVMTKRISEY